MARRSQSRNPFAEQQAPATTELAYDYDQLSASVREDVRRSAIAIKPRLKRAAEDIFVIGKELVAVKNSLPYGQYGVWLDVEFGLSERMAQRFVTVFDRLGGKAEILSDLPPTTLYLLAAPSTPDEVIFRIEKKLASGEPIRVKTVQEAMAATKKPNEVIVLPAVTEDEEREAVDKLDKLLSSATALLAGEATEAWYTLFYNDEMVRMRQILIGMRDKVRRARP